MIQRREIKKPEAPVKELGLHKNNPNTQNKNAVITKAVLSLKPKPVPDPVVETVTPEPVLQRKRVCICFQLTQNLVLLGF